MRGRSARGAVAAFCFVLTAGGARADPGAATAPAQNYLQYCSGCHRLDGTGSARNRVPTLLRSVGHFARTPAGRTFLIQVGGVAQSPLSDAAIAELLNWLLPTFGKAEMPADFQPYSAAEVQVGRDHRPADLMAVRTEIARELRALGYTLATY